MKKLLLVSCAVLLLGVMCVFAEQRTASLVATRESDSPLGRLILGLARASRQQRRRASRCTVLLGDARHAPALSTPRLARASPLLLAQITHHDVAYNYSVSKSLTLLKQARQEGCPLVAIFLQNGRQLVRLIRTADKLRLLEARTHLIIPRDSRMFVPALHNLWRRLVNVVFVQRKGQCYELSTSNFPVPPDPDHPETWQPKFIDLWCHDRLKYRRAIFTDKTKNLQYQPLKVAFYKHMPAAIEVLSEIEPALLGTSLHGIEIELLSLLAQNLQFRAVLLEVANRSEGVADVVARGLADVALGSLPLVSHFLRRVDLSEPYAVYCFTFLTPEALGDLSWYTLLLPLTPEMWQVSAGSFFIAWLALHAVARLQMECSSVFMSPGTSLLYTWSMQFLVSVPSPPRGWPLRLLFGSVWLHCLLLTVAYRSSFAAQLARPPPRFAVDSLTQLAASPHLTPVTWAQHAQELLETSQDKSSQMVGQRLQLADSTELEVAEEIAAGKVAFLENAYLLHHVQQIWQQHLSTQSADGKNGLHIMQECVASLPVSLGFAHNSALTARAGSVLRRATEMGLTAKWLRDATTASPFSMLAATRHQQQALVSLPKIAGAVVALTTGYLLGIIVLLAEILHHFRQQRQQRKN